MERILVAGPVRFSVKVPKAAGRIGQLWVTKGQSPGESGSKVADRPRPVIDALLLAAHDRTSVFGFA
jgi:hypothetical protein